MEQEEKNKISLTRIKSTNLHPSLTLFHFLFLNFCLGTGTIVVPLFFCEFTSLSTQALLLLMTVIVHECWAGDFFSWRCVAGWMTMMSDLSWLLVAFATCVHLFFSLWIYQTDCDYNGVFSTICHEWCTKVGGTRVTILNYILGEDRPHHHNNRCPCPFTSLSCLYSLKITLTYKLIHLLYIYTALL